MSTDTDEINSLLKRHVAAANNGDLEGYGQNLAPDVVYMPPDSPKVSGRDAVLAWMEKAFFDLYVPNFRVEFDEIHTLGSLAFAAGAFSLELTPKSGGERTQMTGKVMNAFRRQEDGSWKYTHAIWNLDGPIPGAAQE